MRKIARLLCVFSVFLLHQLGASAQQSLTWEPTLEEAQKQAARTNRLVLLYFWAPWCGVCKQMEAEVFYHSSVAAELKGDYVGVKINADHFPATAKQYGITALPTTVIALPNGQAVETIRGRLDAIQYVARLARIAAIIRRPANSLVSHQLVSPPVVTPPAATTPAVIASEQPLTAGVSNPSGFSTPNVPPPPRERQSTAPPVANPAYTPVNPPVAATAPTTPPAAPALPPGNPPLGLDGYCPVTLCEQQRWASGDPRWGAIHRGRTYLFAGPEEQRRFFADPDRYAPVISGNDVVLAAEEGRVVPGMREHGVFYRGRIYLFTDEATLEKFSRNPAAYAAQALAALRGGARLDQTTTR